MVHELSLEIPVVTNEKVLKIYDVSFWDENVSSSEIFLDITVPGFTEYVRFSVKRGFDKLLNSSLLNINPVFNINEIENLPDGIYVVRLVNRNVDDEEFVEYNHLRQTKLLNSWYKALCKLRLSPCDTITKEVEEERKKLYQIKSYIDVAKSLVEFCNSPSEGLELHQYAQSLLDKFNKSCKNC